MEIIRAKTAGFCFGVDRAVRMTEQLAREGRRVATLGPLIHNPQCVAALEAQGVVTADSVGDIPQGYEVVIRSHGVGEDVYAALAEKGAVVHDATSSRATGTIRRCRALWATPAGRCTFLPIWRRWRPAPPHSCGKNRHLL